MNNKFVPMSLMCLLWPSLWTVKLLTRPQLGKQNRVKGDRTERWLGTLILYPRGSRPECFRDQKHPQVLLSRRSPGFSFWILDVRDVWGWSCKLQFLTSSQRMLLLMVQGLLCENPCSNSPSRKTSRKYIILLSSPPSISILVTFSRLLDDTQ